MISNKLSLPLSNMNPVLLCATSYPISAKKEYKTNDSSN